MKFIVEGDPQGKARPRMGRYAVYTPKRTRQYEEAIRDAFLQAGGYKLDGYIRVSVDACFRIPDSYSKQKRLDCRYNIIRPDKKPDADNILKVVLDALNGAAYEDDKQVIEVTCRKLYAWDKLGYIQVTVQEIKA